MGNFKRAMVFALLLTIKNAYAQTTAKNVIYLEFLGNTMSYSINYERTIKLNNQFKLAPRLGFSYIPIKKFKLNTDYGNIRIPIELNTLWAKKADAKNFFELGFGLSLAQINVRTRISEEYKDPYFRFARIATVRAGFRHQRPGGGLMYRLGILAPLSQDDFSKERVDNIFHDIFGGISVGYSF
jgi:hypothetical protein